MNTVATPDRSTASGLSLDMVGLAAFVAFPATALYQGIAAAVGRFPIFSETTVLLVPNVVAVLAALVRIPIVGRRMARPALRKAVVYFLLFFATIALATALVYLKPYERDPDRMLQQFAATFAASLVFIAMLGAPSRGAALRSFWVGILVWAAAAVITPLTAFTPVAIGEVQGAYEGSLGIRSFGVLGDGAPFIASFLAVAFFARRKYLWLALTILTLVVSGSRTPLVVAAMGMGMTIVLAVPKGSEERRGARAIRVVMASMLAVALLVALQAAFQLLAKRFGAVNAFDRLSETSLTDTDRFFSITQGLDWFSLSPIYGNGFNAYYYFSLRAAAFGANESTALNQVVQTLVDGGILALLFLILFFVEAVRPASRTFVDPQADPYAVRVWLCAFLVVNQTAVFIGVGSSLTILLFATMGSLVYMREASDEAGVHRPSGRPPAPDRQ